MDILSDSQRAIQESLITQHTKGNQDLIVNNPIYGFTGGQNTCWFASAIQLLMNTQLYKNWINSKPSSDICEPLRNAIETHIQRKVIYPIPTSGSSISDKVINMTDFINNINSLKKTLSNVNPLFNMFTGEQQDSIEVFRHLDNCIDFNCIEFNYKNVYFFFW